MSEEKIAFMFPLHTSSEGKISPIVQYELEKIPVTMEINVKIYFVGLSSDQDYQLSVTIHSPSGELLTAEDSWVDFSVSDSKPSENGSAAGLEATFKGTEITSLGNYSIKAILRNEHTALDSSISFFNMRNA
ncbi:hypothetical protein EFZ10_08455 [Tatumella sp. TA1]|nr:hypothetical protein EFZ10_08455 [Tatumella sp. TA1]